MTGQNRSFWEEELYNQKYDVVIIGAGLTGMSAAYFYKLNQPNKKVLVLDRGIFPIGASTRNAGFACIGSVGELKSDLELEDKSAVMQRVKSRYAGLNLLRETICDENMDYGSVGGWEIFTEQSEYDQVAEFVPQLNEWMEQTIGEEEVYKLGEYQGYKGIFNRVEGLLHPGKALKTLHQKTINVGVEFRWETEVTAISEDRKSISLANDWIIGCEQLLVATNAFSKNLLPDLEVTPGRGYVFITKPMDHLSWKGTFHVDEGYIYFRNLGEDRLLLGGARNQAKSEEETVDFGINPSIKAHLIEFANDVLQLPNGWEIDREWSGIMGFTPSKAYKLEPIGDQAFIAVGLSGMGVALGMQLGRDAAKLMRQNG